MKSTMYKWTLTGILGSALLVTSLMLLSVLMPPHEPQTNTVEQQAIVRAPTIPSSVSMSDRVGVPDPLPTASPPSMPSPLATIGPPPTISYSTAEPTISAGAVTPAPTQITGLVREQTFDGWSYRAVREPDGKIYAEVHFDDQSVSGINAFANANRALLHQLASAGGNERLQVEITLWAPLQPEVYRAWSTDLGITKFGNIHLLGKGIDGGELQLGVVSNSSDPLPKERLDEIVRATTQGTGSITLRGVDSFQADVDSQLLTTVASDPHVFMVDVTGHIVHDDLSKAGVAAAGEARVRTSVLIFVAMESLGIDNFKR